MKGEEETQYPPDNVVVEGWIAVLRDEADAVVGGLRASWRRGPESTPSEECIALLQAVALYRDCRRTIGVPDLPPAPVPNLLTTISSRASVAARYDIETALRIIPDLAPYVVRSGMYGAVSRLPDPQSVGHYSWAEMLSEHEPGVVGEWQGWIWASHRMAPPTQREYSDSDPALADYGDSSLLVVAAGRLSAGLTTVLDA
jgi:hypothetical protein